MKKKNLLATGLLILFSTVLSLLILEQSYRIYLFGSASFSVDKMNSIHHIGVSGLIKPSEYSEVIYDLKPDLNTYFKLAKFETNSSGLRDKDYNLSKSENIFRVAVIGDSVTMPAGVEIEDAYHSLLEEKLNNEQRELTYEFINFGVGGYNLRQYFGVLTRKAEKYDPDLIMIGFCPANDHIVPPDTIFKERYRVQSMTYPFFESFSIRKIKEEIFEKFFITNVFASENEVFFSEKQREYVSGIFSKMRVYGKKRDTPIIIIYLHYWHDEKYASELRKLAIDKELHFVDVSLPFKGKDTSKYRIYLSDAHPNGKANRIFAEQLYDYLNKENFLDQKK